MAVSSCKVFVYFYYYRVSFEIVKKMIAFKLLLMPPGNPHPAYPAEHHHSSL
jgi:hypothetical protein